MSERVQRAGRQAVGAIALAAMVAVWTAGEKSAAAEEPDSLPTLKVSLSLEAAEQPDRWTLRLQNDDTVPVRIVEDWRLLSLDVTPPTPPKGHVVTQHCVLPAEMRPSDDDGHGAILAPGQAFVAAVDPRAYCFEGARERALVPGASVVGRFGFAPSRRHPDSPPLEVSALDDGHASMKEVVSDPFTVPDPPPPPTPSSPPPPASSAPAASPPSQAEGEAPTTVEEDSPARLVVSTPARIDAGSARDLVLPVTVTNPTARRVRVFLRSETIAIDVTNHWGSTFHCQWERPMAPIVDFFSTIPPKGRASASFLVADICPAVFFGWPGLYTLRVTLDTTNATAGDTAALHAFVGEATSAEPTLVRIRTRMSGLRATP